MTRSNKYIEKISQIVELEPGVTYDLRKHDLKVSRDRMAQYINRKDTTSRLFTGGVTGFYGGLVGAAVGDTALKNSRFLPNTVTGRLGRLLGRGTMRTTMGVGALAGGSLGYLTGGLLDSERSAAKDDVMSKLEAKYSNRIDELEGWGHE